MKFLKNVFDELIKILAIAMIAIVAVKAYNNWSYEEPSQMLIDIYKRDNTVHLI